jgi:hypothetical protein
MRFFRQKNGSSLKEGKGNAFCRRKGCEHGIQGNTVVRPCRLAGFWKIYDFGNGKARETMRNCWIIVTNEGFEKVDGVRANERIARLGTADNLAEETLE